MVRKSDRGRSKRRLEEARRSSNWRKPSQGSGRGHVRIRSQGRSARKEGTKEVKEGTEEAQEGQVKSPGPERLEGVVWSYWPGSRRKYQKNAAKEGKESLEKQEKEDFRELGKHLIQQQRVKCIGSFLRRDQRLSSGGESSGSLSSCSRRGYADKAPESNRGQDERSYGPRSQDIGLRQRSPLVGEAGGRVGLHGPEAQGSGVAVPRKPLQCSSTSRTPTKGGRDFGWKARSTRSCQGCKRRPEGQAEHPAPTVGSKRRWKERREGEGKGTERKRDRRRKGRRKEGRQGKGKEVRRAPLPGEEGCHKEEEMTVCNVACGLEVCGNSEERPTFPSFTDSMSVSRTFAQMGGLVEGMMKRFVNLNPTWRSKSSPSGDLGRFFPLVPDHALQDLPGSDADSWMSCICMGLNSYYGAEILPKTVRLPRASGAKSALKGCREAVELTLNWSETSESFSWEEFWKVKSVDYRGDEVQVAQSFAWKNIEPTIPPQVGTIPLSAVCGEGALAYVENFEEFLIPEADQVLLKPPRVQVQDSDWEAVVQGLVSRKLCCIMPVKDLYHVGGRPVLNGLFGVSKHEFTDGVEHLRLIMNLCPINALCRPLHSDIGTLPSWACVGPLFLGDHQDLVVSSEDIRCFFYNFEIPVEWRKYMGFNKLVPPHLTPNEHAGEDCVLASAVLPMGFLNSVGIAQHIHRRVVLAARHKEPGLPQGEAEIRKDRPATNTSQMWRVYLDNYDELEKMDRETADKIAGTMSDPTALVRAEYLKQGLPRHEKKGVQQSRLAEVQGAMVDGHAGLVYPKPQKILKYIQVVARLLEDGWSTQRLYVSMFRRPLLGTLNALWRHIESFKGEPPVVRKQLPKEVEWEFLRFLGLLPLAHINLRLGIDATVTASDASLVGGGFCASSGLTPYGCAAANLEVRGDVPEWEDMDRVLSIGLFDGIGALRVALDAI